MNYPYFLLNRNAVVSPLFGDLIKGQPIEVPMDDEGGLFEQFHADEQERIQAFMEEEMQKAGTNAAFSGYLEPRRMMLEQKNCKEMVEETRFYHLGLDVTVAEGSPLFAPLDGEVFLNMYEEGNGQYGGMMVLKHESSEFETFYSIYGHLQYDESVKKGDIIRREQQFARIGGYEENGQWFTHVHLQVLTDQGFNEGFLHKGYCNETDMLRIDQLVPNPGFLFKY